MTHTNTQKGLQGLKHVVRDINVAEDGFTDFLTWLLNEKGFTSTGLIDVVDSPHTYIELWEEYHEQNG